MSLRTFLVKIVGSSANYSVSRLHVPSILRPFASMVMSSAYVINFISDGRCGMFHMYRD